MVSGRVECAVQNCTREAIALPVLLFYAPLETYERVDRVRQSHIAVTMALPTCEKCMDDTVKLDDLIGSDSSKAYLSRVFSEQGKHVPDWTRTELKWTPLDDPEATSGGAITPPPERA